MLVDQLSSAEPTYHTSHLLDYEDLDFTISFK